MSLALVQHSAPEGDFEVYELNSGNFEFIVSGYAENGAYESFNFVLSEGEVDALVERLQIVLADRGERPELFDSGGNVPCCDPGGSAPCCT